MTGGDHLRRILQTLTLRRSLDAVNTPLGKNLVAITACLYALGSMMVGDMLTFSRTGAPTIYITVLPTPVNYAWWDFPAVEITAPGGQLVLPFFATLATVIVSIGVGVGMSVGVVLAVRLLRERKGSLGAPTALSSAAGLTPAMIALVTLGACCTTTAAATAGVGLVAQTSGTSATLLLTYNWYLAVFQMGVLWAALVAQEQIIAVYGALFKLTPATADSASGRVTDPGRSLARLLLRIGLLVGGVTWALAMVAEWITVSPFSASAGVWGWWFFEHIVPAGTAVAVALSPRSSLEWLAGLLTRSEGLLVRVVIAAGALLLLTWVPEPVVVFGMHGLVNEVLGALNEPSSWGSVSPDGLSGLALVLRWGFQFLLPGTFCLALAAAPARVLGALNPPMETLDPEYQGLSSSAHDDLDLPAERVA